MTDERSRRAAVVPISFQELGNLLMMPQDMTVMHINVDHALATLYLAVKHPDLAPVLDDNQIPTLLPVITEFDYGTRREADWGDLGIVSWPCVKESPTEITATRGDHMR